jgi:hypothetical protein
MNVSVNGQGPTPAIACPAQSRFALAKITAWFADRSDARARRHGWSVEIRAGGMSRRYRDPRFDSLRAGQSGPQ